MNKRKLGIAAATLLLVIGGTVWAIHSRADAQMEKVREMGKEMFSGNGPPDPEKRAQFREAMDQLSSGQRERLMEEGQQERERRMDQRMAEYFALPPAQQTAFLDKEIREQERQRKEREARRAQANQSGQAGANASGGQRGNRQNRSAEDQSQRRNKRLDNSTPEQRAQRTAYRAAMQQRRQQLGLPSGGGGPRGRG
jgi:hypothetical protein